MTFLRALVLTVFAAVIVWAVGALAVGLALITAGHRGSHRWRDVVPVGIVALGWPIVLYMAARLDGQRGWGEVRNLPPIGSVPCRCDGCGWRGCVDDCEPDVDGEGSLGCPVCFEALDVQC